MDDAIPTERVVVTRGMVGICHMQVCVVEGATDEEILDICNIANPSGTTHGWAKVYRATDEFWTGTAPVPCLKDSTRTHLLVGC